MDTNDAPHMITQITAPMCPRIIEAEVLGLYVFRGIQIYDWFCKISLKCGKEQTYIGLNL